MLQPPGDFQESAKDQGAGNHCKGAQALAGDPWGSQHPLAIPGAIACWCLAGPISRVSSSSFQFASPGHQHPLVAMLHPIPKWPPHRRPSGPAIPGAHSAAELGGAGRASPAVFHSILYLPEIDRALVPLPPCRLSPTLQGALPAALLGGWGHCPPKVKHRWATGRPGLFSAVPGHSDNGG